MKQIESNSKENSRACVVIQDDEGFDWSKFLPEEDFVGYTFTAQVKIESTNKHSAFVAEIKEKTTEEILKEKTERERFFADCRIQKMHEEFEDAKFYGRYDKKRECYINKNGDLVVRRREVVYNDVLAVIPLSGEYYLNVEKDRNYLKMLDKIIQDVMTASLKRRDEKNVDELVDDFKKVAEKEKVEDVKEEEVVTKKQQNEDDLKKKEEDDVKIERMVEVIDADDAAKEKQNKEAGQKQTEEKAEVQINEVNTSTESSKVLKKTVEQCKKCMETCSACTEKVENFRTRDIEVTNIEKVFKEK
ncbi:hypothetical protein Hdeb2414_s0037g00732211 [Helianthus debilis subsp. tardiflorus]